MDAAAERRRQQETGPAPKWTGPPCSSFPWRRCIDRAAFDARSRSTGRAARGRRVEFRKSVVDVLARALEQGRETARRGAGGQGRRPRLRRAYGLCRRRVVRAPSIPAWPHSSSPARRREACASSRSAAMAAATLAPGSDIDLLFLLPGNNRAGDEAVIEADALPAVGPQAEGRPFDAHGRGMPEAGARRHDHSHRAARGALPPRRPALFDDHARAFRSGDRAQRRAGIRRRQAGGARRAHRSAPARRAIWSSRTSRRARAACAISTRCSGSRNTSIACGSRGSLVGVGLFTRAELRLFRRCEEFLWRCAAICIS